MHVCMHTLQIDRYCGDRSLGGDDVNSYRRYIGLVYDSS
jgi:hypothetical protein